MTTARSRLKSAILKAAEWEEYYESMALKLDMLRGDQAAARRNRKDAKAWHDKYQTLYAVAMLADDIMLATDLSFTREIDYARQSGRSRAFRDFCQMIEDAA